MARFAALPAFLALVQCLTAQPFTLANGTIAGGGGASFGGQFELSGAIGQSFRGVSSGGNYSLEGGFWNLYVALHTPGAPTLTVRRVGANVEMSWPVAGSTGYVLEGSAALGTTASWSAVGVTPVVADGLNQVTLAIQPGTHFFRLRSMSE